MHGTTFAGAGTGTYGRRGGGPPGSCNLAPGPGAAELAAAAQPVQVPAADPGPGPGRGDRVRPLGGAVRGPRHGERGGLLVQLGGAAGHPGRGLGGHGGHPGQGPPIELTWFSPTTALVECLETTHGRVGRLLAGLPAATWGANVPATPAWSVADVVAHLADGDRSALAAAQGAWELPGSLEEWTAAGVAAHQGEAPEARLEGWEAAADAFRWHLAALDAEGWRGRVPWVAGTTSVKTLGVLRLNDAWHHGRDLAEVAGEPFEVDGPTLAFLADLAARTIPGGLSRRGRPHPGAVILLRLGPDRWLLGGAAGERPDPGAAPDLVLEADPLAFVLRAAGRTADDPWRAQGDPTLAVDVAATLSSVT